MDDVRCPLCTRREARILIDHGVQKTVECGGCGLAYVAPRLAGPEAAVYDEDYFRGKKINETTDYTRETDWAADEGRHRKYLTRIHRHHRPPGKLLDLGAGTGLFLRAAIRAGWQAVGQDVSQFSARFAAEHFGITIHNHLPSELPLDPGTIDVITCWHALEHMRDPASFLRGAAPLLAPDGLLFLEVPNFGGLQARINRGDWMYSLPLEHLIQFTPGTMRKLLEASGYQQVHWTTLKTDPWDLRNALVSIGVPVRWKARLAGTALGASAKSRWMAEEPAAGRTWKAVIKEAMAKSLLPASMLLSLLGLENLIFVTARRAPHPDRPELQHLDGGG